MRVLIIGGHLSPALSVIEHLKGEDIYFVGRKYGLEGDKALTLEYQTINNLGIPFFEITTGRVTRTLSKHTLLSISKMPLGFAKAVSIIKKVKPDVILGFGGYVSVPVVTAGSLLGIPIVLHEQTLEAGLANKVLARFATKICISFESSREYFPKNKSILTGLPLKKDILDAKKTAKSKNSVPLIYITGGSAGSHKINDMVYKNLPKLLEKFKIVHQTGDAHEFMDFDRLTELKNSLGQKLKDNYEIHKFLNSSQVVNFMVNADLVVSRSGANTVAELIFLEKPSFLIPLHFSQRDEQLKNARLAAKLGIAKVVDETLLTEEGFLETINEMIQNIKTFKLNEQNIINADGAEKIVRVIQNVSKKTQA